MTGRPGTGIGSASAGRWIPGARLTLNSPAANAAPVPPAQTSACARPSPRARAACTIEACGVDRTARAGSGLLATDTGRVDQLDAVWHAADLSGWAEQQHARSLAAAASAAPAATSAGPRSAPLASTATTGAHRGPTHPPSARRPLTPHRCDRRGRDRGRDRALRGRRPRDLRRFRTPGKPGAACAAVTTRTRIDRGRLDLVVGAPSAVRLCDCFFLGTAIGATGYQGIGRSFKLVARLSVRGLKDLP